MKIYLDVAEKYQIGFQDEATPIMIGIRSLHDTIMYYLIIIVTVVSFLMIKLMLKSSSKLNWKYITHSTVVEVIWTIIPALILVVIAIPSFKLLYSMDEILKPIYTLKITGYQWYWNYSISDIEGLTVNFDSYIIPESELTNNLRLLEVDNRVLLPILTPIRLIVTADDVIHSFALPSAGIKVDAIPGRINQTSLYFLREGIFHGQCSELCGLQHAFMPIVIEGVKNTEFYSWLLSFSSIPLSKFVSTLASLKAYLY